MYKRQLQACGLSYIVEGVPIDMIVVDQQHGPVTNCDWIEFARLGIDGGKVGAAWLWDKPRMGHGIHMSAEMTIAMPPGWHFKDSLSDKFQFVPNHLLPQRRDN